MLVGDSLAVGMAPHFASLAKEARVAFDGTMAKESTRIDQWAGSQKLGEKLDAFKPTLVLVSLGTNDEYMPGDAVSRQRPYFDKLWQRMHSVADVVWIGPPTLPKPSSNGVVAMLRSAVPKDRYFASDTLSIPRGPDNLHPTAKGYAGWSGAIWAWLS